MAEIIAVTNQKGGVGKTTTSLNLGAGLRQRGKRVLFVDMDPQCSLTYIMDGSSEGRTVQDLLLGKCNTVSSIQKLREGDLIAAAPGLSTLDMVLTGIGRAFKLRNALHEVRDDYDYIVVDSPPTLGILTVNVLTAANCVIIPALADIFSLQGVGQLYSTIQTIKEFSNPNLIIRGILLIRHTDRFILHRSMRDMLEETAEQIGTSVFKTSIREAVTVREAEAQQQSLFAYAPKSKQARDYEDFVSEFLSAKDE